MGLHLVRDLCRGGWQDCRNWREREREDLFRHHALHCVCGLVHLPSRLLLRIPHGGVADCTLNLVYNLADFVNKIAFCLAIWASAKKDTMERAGKEILLA